MVIYEEVLKAATQLHEDLWGAALTFAVARWR